MSPFRLPNSIDLEVFVEKTERNFEYINERLIELEVITDEARRLIAVSESR